jgi:hypothetical protein
MKLDAAVESKFDVGCRSPIVSASFMTTAVKILFTKAEGSKNEV